MRHRKTGARLPVWREDAARLRPMLAVIGEAPLGEAPLMDAGLVYEPKYDGVRALAEVTSTGVRLWSRNGAEKTNQFPEVAAALAALRGPPAVVDGEITALDTAGEPLGFEALQPRIHLTGAADVRRRMRDVPVAFFAFDILRVGEEDLRGLPLLERKARLEAYLGRGTGPLLRRAQWRKGDGRALLEEVRRQGGEGLVVKDAASPYRVGVRGPHWRKMKILQRQELLVGGWTEPRGSRETLGALLLGVHDEKDSRPRYAGHVGTGFDRRMLATLGRRLAALKTDVCPFRVVPPSNERPHWVRPELVVEVKFTGWTEAGYLRHPVFVGVRDDKAPSEVKREPSAGAGNPERSARQGSRARARVAVTADQATGKRKRSGPGPRGKKGALPDRDLAAVVERLDEIEAGRGSGRVPLPGGLALDVTNLGKPFWPALGVTKGELIRHYARVAPYILPVVDERPLVMRRFPNGVEGPAFYQHRAPEPVPEGVRVASLPDDPIAGGPSGRGQPPTRLVGGGLVTLLYMAQLATVSQDPWFSRVKTSQFAEEVALDLDPMPGVSFARVLDVARWIRDELAPLRVPAFPKTSGATGLHIFIPLPPRTSYEAGRLFTQIVATVVARRHPRVATVERSVGARGSTVYIDYLQNIRGKTLACAYSARASEYAGVSMPVTWKEIDGKLDPREFTIATAPARLAAVGDLWAGLRTGAPANLSAALEALGRTVESPKRPRV